MVVLTNIELFETVVSVQSRQICKYHHRHDFSGSLSLVTFETNDSLKENIERNLLALMN